MFGKLTKLPTKIDNKFSGICFKKPIGSLRRHFINGDVIVKHCVKRRIQDILNIVFKKMTAVDNLLKECLLFHITYYCFIEFDLKI